MVCGKTNIKVNFEAVIPHDFKFINPHRIRMYTHWDTDDVRKLTDSCVCVKFDYVNFSSCQCDQSCWFKLTNENC